MAINNWLKDEQPREKLLAKGSTSLSDTELLAILLRTGTKGKNAIELARELLIAFNGLDNLLAAPVQELCKHSGIGTTKYSQLQAAIELARRYLQANLQNRALLNNSAITKQFVLAKLKHYKQEVFACLFLDNRNQLISYEELFFGSINFANIHPREIIKKALTHNAASVILAHNHPSGIAEPSKADYQLTKELKKTLATLDIRVVDHIIVAANQTISLSELPPNFLSTKAVG